MEPSKEEERKLKEHKDDSPTKLDIAEKTTLLHFVVHENMRTEGVRLSSTDQTTSSTLTEDVKCPRLGLQVVSNVTSDLSNVKNLKPKQLVIKSQPNLYFNPILHPPLSYNNINNTHIISFLENPQNKI
jgi:hypothetical protein